MEIHEAKEQICSVCHNMWQLSWASFGTEDVQAADYAACKFYGLMCFPSVSLFRSCVHNQPSRFRENGNADGEFVKPVCKQLRDSFRISGEFSAHCTGNAGFVCSLYRFPYKCEDGRMERII